MNIAIIILVILIGLSIGSFLNVVIFRLDDLQSILKTRSKCPHCQKEIAWYDLVPFLSFVLLRGRCRSCQKNISYQYPLVEVGTALVFLSFYFKFGLSWALAFYCLVFSLLIIIFTYDLLTESIPEIISWIALFLAVLGGWYFGGFGVANMLYGALIGGGLLAFLVLISKEKWMGAGDIKIGFALGALTGFPSAILFLFLAFVLGSVFGLTLIALKSKKLKDSLPFAPFLISSAFLTLHFSSFVISWYLDKLS